ncbi:MAG: response regulator transcription factor [Actinobacteria bacterium]|nr:response regulator transcription factor [Actinomycetota bacterium]
MAMQMARPTADQAATLQETEAGRAVNRRPLSGARRRQPAARRILLVDDDVQLLVQLAERLKRDGFSVSTARSGKEALQQLDKGWPEIIVLDLMMPGMDGEEVAAQIKRRADLPIIVLSAITAGESKVKLIERYAEDYITKPFEYTELRARIKRVRQRLGAQIPGREIRLGPDLTLVPERKECFVAGKRVKLSPTEVRVLTALAANLGKVVTTDQLTLHGWSEIDAADPSYVWVAIRRLRQKIEIDPDHPRYLLTERGVGYRLVPAA